MEKQVTATRSDNDVPRLPMTKIIKTGEKREKIQDAVYRMLRQDFGDKLGAKLQDGDGNWLTAESNNNWNGPMNKTVEIEMGSMETEEWAEKSSFSYAGLPCRYLHHKVDVFVRGLPEKDFETKELKFDEDELKISNSRQHVQAQPATSSASGTSADGDFSSKQPFPPLSIGLSVRPSLADPQQTTAPLAKDKGTATGRKRSWVWRTDESDPTKMQHIPCVSIVLGGGERG
jgi:hypothetical protein